VAALQEALEDPTPEEESPDQVEGQEDPSSGSSSEEEGEGEQAAGARVHKLVLFFCSILFSV
jgi:hypothetical protein